MTELDRCYSAYKATILQCWMGPGYTRRRFLAVKRKVQGWRVGNCVAQPIVQPQDSCLACFMLCGCFDLSMQAA